MSAQMVELECCATLPSAAASLSTANQSLGSLDDQAIHD